MTCRQSVLASRQVQEGTKVPFGTRLDGEPSLSDLWERIELLRKGVKSIKILSPLSAHRNPTHLISFGFQVSLIDRINFL